jgi:hypothetical protein
MSSYTVDKSSSTNPLNYTEEEDGEEGAGAESDEDVEFDGNLNVMTPIRRNQMNSSYDPSDWSAGFSELLPAGLSSSSDSYDRPHLRQ